LKGLTLLGFKRRRFRDDGARAEKPMAHNFFKGKGAGDSRGKNRRRICRPAIYFINKETLRTTK